MTATDELARDPASWWVLVLIGTAVLIAIAELGFRLGRRQLDPGVEARKGPTSLGTTALLGLLGLMLGFSFSLVQDRFVLRKALVLEEANAIGTTYLRAAMLPAPHGERIRKLLREYVEARVDPTTPEQLHAALVRSERMHDELWSEATAMARVRPESEIASIFVQSLNNLIDLHEARVTVALYQRLPKPILRTLWILAMLAALALGFGSGLGRHRALLSTTTLLLAVASVIVLIMELDKPMGHMFEINQSAILDVKELMEADAPPTAAR